jgi:hypothetical protein
MSAQLNLLEKPNWAEAYTPEDRDRDIERLIPLARELAQKAGQQGITVSNLRLAAVSRGLLTGQETGRRLSFLGAVMRRAALINTGQWRRSDIGRSHGNLNAIWILEGAR